VENRQGRNAVSHDVLPGLGVELGRGRLPVGNGQR
jgi:hypothetical protein